MTLKEEIDELRELVKHLNKEATSSHNDFLFGWQTQTSVDKCERADSLQLMLYEEMDVCYSALKAKDVQLHQLSVAEEEAQM